MNTSPCVILLLALMAIEPAGARGKTHSSGAYKKLSHQIETIFSDSTFSSAFIGARIVSLPDGRVIYDRNSKKLFHPASNMKLLTTAAALHILGKDFQFTTAVWADGTLMPEGVLRGNLIVEGRGDPLLETADLDTLAEALAALGIRSVQGDLTGDVRYFDDLHWGQGWIWDDEPQPEEAFLTPLTVNGNTIRVVVTPGNLAGTPVLVELVPPSGFFSVTNTGITSRDPALPPLDVTRTRGKNRITVKGAIPPGNPPAEYALSVYTPEMYFLELLRERLASHSIRVEGSLRIDSLAPRKRLARISHPLDSVLVRVNKMSDNIGAENLLKALAAEKTSPPGSAHAGLLLVKEYLASARIDTSLMILADGSGVSFYDALSPALIVQLLGAEHGHRSTFRRFYQTLPVAGVDGTLKNRMKGTAAEGNVHAKTGTITGGSSLSGYLTTHDGVQVAFSILCNHFPLEIKLLRDAQDRILELLARSDLRK